jgi:Putative MetA-pathway of phenol degradation
MKARDLIVERKPEGYRFGGRMAGPRRQKLRRGLHCLGIALAVACAPSFAAADDDESPKAGQPDNPFYALDTKNLFGFLEGADVGEAGDKSLEFETTGASGKAEGRFQSVEQEFVFEPTLTDSLGLEFGAHVLGQNVKGVPDLPDFTGVDFMGLSVEARYVVKHRSAASPVQVTLTVEPEWDAISDAGQRVVDFNATFRAIGDWQSADRRVYGAVNLVYTPDGSRLPGQVWEKTSTFGASAALSYRVTPPLMFGAEADYDRAYSGVAPQGYRGQALYLGPTFHYQISEKIDFSAAFIAQATPRPLDLSDFPRRLARLRLEVEF